MASAPPASSTECVTGSIQVSTACQIPGICSSPPMTDSTASVPTGQSIDSGPSNRSLCRCSRAKAETSPKKTMNRSLNV